MARQKTAKGKIGAEIGRFKGKEYPLPKGYRLKEDNLKYDYDLGRYLWRPEEGDFVYYPKSTIGKVFEYLGWGFSPGVKGGYRVTMDGYGHLRNIETGKDFWVDNIEAREGIPMRKI